MKHEELTLQINGAKRTGVFPRGTRLLDAIRRLGFTGTKEGCGEGECGACTVLVDGQAVNSCLIPTCQAAGTEVTTIVGLGGSERLHKLPRAFLECGGAQCGICTPGMILAAAALPPRPSLEQIRVGLAGNLCRCTGYMKIYDAVEQALGGPAPAATSAPKRVKRVAKGKATTKAKTKRRTPTSTPTPTRTPTKGKR